MRFLSGEWIERLAAAVSAGSPAGSLSIHQRVTGGPDGDVEYTLHMDEGSVTVEPGPGPADVQIVQDYATAAAISRGMLSPAAAFAAGRLRLGGEVACLVEHQEAVASLGRLLTRTSEGTTY